MLAPAALRSEYLTHPLAIQRARPRLSFELSGAGAQTAYQLQATTTDFSDAPSRLWDTGKVESSTSLHIEYGGRSLSSCMRVKWRARVWDEQGEASPFSEPAEFAMGLLTEDDWQAQWIQPPESQRSPNSCCFRRTFETHGEVVDARLYATAKGIYTASINGLPVSDESFAPGWTDYNQRILYRCYDVTSRLLGNNRHAIGAFLNPGWYAGPLAFHHRPFQYVKQPGDKRPSLLMTLRLEYADGRVEWVGTDSEWRVHNGPILESTFLRGETHDATLTLVGFDTPEFDESGWAKVSPSPIESSPKLEAHIGPPVRATEELSPIRMFGSRPGSYIYDFGQNFAGRVRLRVAGQAGTTVRIRFGEMLWPKNELYVDNLRSATSIDTYTCSGGGEEMWEPKFTYHGFRYAELTGFPGTPSLDALTGIVVHSDTPKAGSFECSNALINQLVQNIDWTQRSNFVDIPTDCPQRDERLGWTGDVQVYIRSAIWNRDVSAFFNKWLQDLIDSQDERGNIPNYAPKLPHDHVHGMGGDAAWGDVATVAPWALYWYYGDTEFLTRSYSMMLRWLEYLERESKDGLRTPDPAKYKIYGDWVCLGPDTPHEIIMTAFFAHSAELAANTADILRKKEDAARLRSLHARIRTAFIERFVQPNGDVRGLAMDPVTQTGQVLALHFNLVPEELRGAAFARLVNLIEENNFHLATGFVGIPYLLPTLSRHGRTDLAYRLVLNETYPSWGFSIKNGATTIWERWNSWTEEGPNQSGMNSYSHYAFGSVAQWLYEHVAGIEATSPGFKTFRLRPSIGGGLTHVNASWLSQYGRIASHWKLEGGKLEVNVEVPANTSAEVWIPCPKDAAVTEHGRALTNLEHRERHAILRVAPGRYCFSTVAP
ncbi:MAG: family 78 glycoside hydrolase catalytic domain [Polyangiaceae bacterium]|nr:family 78 glycoside hydrolase catalytic domain [Polyangiaceae bacterium]